MIGDPLVSSNTFSDTNDSSYILRNIYIAKKQEIFSAATISTIYIKNFQFNIYGNLIRQSNLLVLVTSVK